MSGSQLCLPAGFRATHTAQTTQKFLRETMADFWTLADWLSFSPDLNLLDFST
jgi:hypothetical protein